MQDPKKPLLCRIGIHTSYYADSAWFITVQRCNRCDEPVKDKGQAVRLQRERELWPQAARAHPKDLQAQLAFVASRLSTGEA